jgi:uncharacterized membrane protein
MTMHQLIEDYLADVAAGLHPLPIKRRNEELKEMRQHLQNAVLVNKEFGQFEAEAVENAVEQFGVPQELAEHLVQTWRRGEKIENKRSFRGATASTLALLILQHQVDHFIAFHTNISRFLWPLGLYGYLIIVPLGLCVTILPGWVAGTFFQKRAVQGTAFALIVCNGIETARLISEHQVCLPSMFVVASIYSLIPVLSAWVTVRGREKALKRGEAVRLFPRA